MKDEGFMDKAKETKDIDCSKAANSVL